MESCKLLIFGGGSLLQDVTSDKSLWYYLAVISAAMKRSVPVMLYANGIGPVRKEKNRKKVGKMLEKASLITLRDSESVAEVKKMCGMKKTIHLTADPALTISGVSAERAAGLLKEAGVPEGKKLLGISVRSWKGCGSDFYKQMAAGIDEICIKYDLVPVWIPLKIPDDIAATESISAHMKQKGYILSSVYNAEEIVGVAGSCELMIAMRLHAVIYATAKGVPAIGITYDPKVSGFMNEIGVDTQLGIENVKADSLFDMAGNILEQKDAICAALQEKSMALAEKARENAEFAMQYISEKDKR